MKTRKQGDLGKKLPARFDVVPLDPGINLVLIPVVPSGMAIQQLGTPIMPEGFVTQTGLLFSALYPRRV
jgi:hypothetical protein